MSFDFIFSPPFARQSNIRSHSTVVELEISLPAMPGALVGFLCFVLLVPGLLFAQTEVSGEVSGEWNAEGNPYIVIDSTWVPEGEELIINRGVIVQVVPATGIHIFGSLNAIGTEEDSVHFTSHEEEEWAGLYFYGRQIVYEFDYCTIRNSVNGLVASGETGLNVSNSDINCSYIAFGVINSNSQDSRNNSYNFESSIFVGGRVVYFNSSRLTAVDCYFSTGSENRWGFGNSGSIEMTECNFIGTLDGYFMRGIFRRCNFYRSESDHCYVWVTGGGSRMEDCYVDGGVHLLSTNADFHNNEIEGTLTVEVFSGSIHESILGSLSLGLSLDPITVVNCLINRDIVISDCDSVEIYNCQILGNDAPGNRAIRLRGLGNNISSYSIHHNLILGNLYSSGEIDLTLKNNTLITESPHQRPLIRCLIDEGSVDITNNILMSTGENDGLYDPHFNGAENPIIKDNCIFGFEQFIYGNNELEFDLDYSNLYEVDPMLMSLDIPDHTLHPESPCIDTGNPNSQLDPDSTRADIGAYYFHHELNISEHQLVEIPKLEVLNVYPNPFNGVMKLNFSLNQPSIVEINIFNTLGRHLAEIVSGRFPVGSQIANWDGSAFPSGDYIVLIAANGQASTRKIAMIK
jgi:hypothetical protein